jgi:hypothetical protein
MTAARPRLQSALRLAAGALAAITVGALLIAALGAAPWVREQLDFRFAGPARRPAAAIDIAATNGCLAAAPLLSAWAVQRRPGLRVPLDASLGILAAANVAVMAAALGAYGLQLLGSVALHGALELGGFAVCAAAYLAARHHALSRDAVVGASVLALALLAAAALVETYVQLGAGR